MSARQRYTSPSVSHPFTLVDSTLLTMGCENAKAVSQECNRHRRRAQILDALRVGLANLDAAGDVDDFARIGSNSWQLLDSRVFAIAGPRLKPPECTNEAFGTAWSPTLGLHPVPNSGSLMADPS